MEYFDLIKEIKPTDEQKGIEAKNKWNKIAKPLDGMGVLEDYICKIYSINGLNIDKKCVAVFCADNGIVEENVTQTSSDVTATVARNITNGNATICHMAKIAKADVFPVDVGMLTEVENVPLMKTKRGTNNFLKTVAMSKEEAIFAIEKGIETAKILKDKGYNLIATGEMGIGNTTTSSAVTASIFSVDAKLVSGKGAGLSKEGIAHKADVINKAIALHKPNPNDPIDILSKVGGFDIASMCGLFLGGGIYNIPILMDGFISYVAAMLAIMLNKEVADYIIPSHISYEYGSKLILEKTGFNPPLSLKMALGEGTGAVAMMPLIDMANEIFTKMVDFNNSGFEEYTPQ